MKLDNDINESLKVLESFGCTVLHNDTELEIRAESKNNNGYVFQFLSILIARLNNCRDNYYLWIIDNVNDFKHFGLGLNQDYRLVKTGYLRLIEAGKFSFIDSDLESKYTFIFSPTDEP